jgi:hypothetical protein
MAYEWRLKYGALSDRRAPARGAGPALDALKTKQIGNKAAIKHTNTGAATGVVAL